MKKYLVSAAIVVSSLSMSAFGYSMSCTGYTGCDQCFGFELGTTNSVADVFVPRTGLTDGQKEQIDSTQSTITAQTLQGAPITPTGNVLASYSPNYGPSATQWTWASTSGIKLNGSLPSTIDYTKPVYRVDLKTHSYVVNSSNAKISGTDIIHKECVFFFPKVVKINGYTGTVHTTTQSSLSENSASLCRSGKVFNFRLNGTRWEWTCQGSGGGTSEDGWANKASTSTVINGQLGPIHNTNQSSLSSNNGGLCNSGNVDNFAYDSINRRWTWICRGSGGGTSISGIAYESSTGGNNRIDGELGSRHRSTVDSLSSGSSGLCRAGTVSNFRYDANNRRWTWTCRGLNGGTDIDGYAYEDGVTPEEPVSDECSIRVQPRSGVAPLDTSILCRGGSDDTRPLIVIKQGTRILDSYESGSKNYTFDKAGTYTVQCYPHATSSQRDNVCSTTVTANGECGNGVRESGEQCDDGDALSGDGCSRMCTVESDDGEQAICGNGVRESGEQCDDGNDDNGDSCTNICQSQTPKTGNVLWIMILCLTGLTAGVWTWRQKQTQ